MKKYLLSLFLLLALCLTGCEDEAVEVSEGHMLYFLSNLEHRNTSGGDAICAVPADTTGLNAMGTKEAAVFLLRQLEKSKGGCISPLPEGVTVNKVELQGRRAYVDMSSGYGELTGIDLSLADYCITLTLCQLDEIASVFITSDGRAMLLRDSQVMLEQDVVLSGMEDIVSTVQVQLWFLDSENQLSLENRELELYEGQTMVEAVADALEEGPRDQEHSAIFPEGFELGSVWMDDGVCSISIPPESVKAIPKQIDLQEKILAAISRSYFSLEAVQELQLLVAGAEIGIFGHISVEPFSHRPPVNASVEIHE